MTTPREHVSSAELVGRLGQVPELQHTDGGQPYVRMSLATSETFTAKDGRIVDRTEWHNAVAWGPQAEEIAKTLGKGDSVILAGTLHVNGYEKDGVKNRVTELHVQDAKLNRDNAPSGNKSRLVGLVREPPTSRTLDSGVEMTTLSLATKLTVPGKDGPREREDWHSVTLWGKAAIAARDIHAGDTVSVNGTLRHRTVPGEAGQDRKLSAIEGHKFQVLERARGHETPTLASPETAPERQRRARGGNAVGRGL